MGIYKDSKKLITDFVDNNKINSSMMVEFMNANGDIFLNICFIPHRMNVKEILQFISESIIYLL